MAVTTTLKSPLRYPGGKSKAVKTILPLIPDDIKEYREPFIGGGSIFFATKGVFGDRIRYVLNDLNHDLILFWQHVRDCPDRLTNAITELRSRYTGDGRGLFDYLHDKTNMHGAFDRAVRFFIMNRITFSGLTDSGGYSSQAFDHRFTASSIDRVRKIAQALKGVEILHGDYKSVVERDGDNVFIFLDPPYYISKNSCLYGRRGDLHKTFDHARFADIMRDCKHRWLITYNDSPYIRDLFSFARIDEWQLQYGMNNVNSSYAIKGRELLIRNY